MKKLSVKPLTAGMACLWTKLYRIRMWIQLILHLARYIMWNVPDKLVISFHYTVPSVSVLNWASQEFTDYFSSVECLVLLPDIIIPDFSLALTASTRKTCLCHCLPELLIVVLSRGSLSTIYISFCTILPLFDLSWRNGSFCVLRTVTVSADKPRLRLDQY